MAGDRKATIELTNGMNFLYRNNKIFFFFLGDWGLTTKDSWVFCKCSSINLFCTVIHGHEGAWSQLLRLVKKTTICRRHVGDCKNKNWPIVERTMLFTCLWWDKCLLCQHVVPSGWSKKLNYWSPDLFMTMSADGDFEWPTRFFYFLW